MLNVAAIMGRLTKEPELKTTKGGVSVCAFDVAVERNYQKEGEKRQTDFIHVVAWRQTAEFVARYFRKGQMIAVNGSIETTKYEDKHGNKRELFQIRADNVSFCGNKGESEAVKMPYSAPQDKIDAYDAEEVQLPF